MLRQHLRREAADPRQLRRLGAEQRRERHPVDVAARRRGRRVHVAVRVHPDQAERLAARGGRSRRSPRPSRPPGCGRRRARSGCRRARARRATSCRAARRPSAISRMYFLAGSPSALISGIGATRSPSSTTGKPSAESRSASPAMRNADGPMSTPRRLPPRSSETPMMWAARMGFRGQRMAAAAPATVLQRAG